VDRCSTAVPFIPSNCNRPMLLLLFQSMPSRLIHMHDRTILYTSHPFLLPCYPSSPLTNRSRPRRLSVPSGH
jgi:hypothetical protein